MIMLPENIRCGYCDCSEFGGLHVSPQRIVKQYEIEFYLADGFTTTADDKTYDIRKYFVQIAVPGQVRHSVLPFQTAYLKFSVEGELADALSAAPKYFCSSHPQVMLDLIKEIISLHENENHILLQSRILSLLYLVLTDSQIPSERQGENYYVISNAEHYMKEHYAEHITLSDIAESVHLSSIYFHNIFTSALGMTPHQYLTNYRIEKVKEYLWSSQKSIGEIAEMTGFGCRQYLNKVFKKETGMTPVSYRKTFQKNYLL